MILADDDRVQLLGYLDRMAQRFLDAPTRRDVLNVVLAGAAPALGYALDSFAFANELTAWLNDQPIPASGAEAHPLVRLLRAFLRFGDEYGFHPEDLSQFEIMIRAVLERSRQSVMAARVRRRNAEREAAGLRLSRSYDIRAEELMLRFDLQPQRLAFGKSVPYPPQGVVALAAGYDYDFFMSYVHPALLDYLRELGVTDVWPREIWIHHGDLSQWDSGTVVDEVADTQADMLLRVVHETPPTPVMRQAAATVVDALRQRIAAAPRRRLLVVVWLRVSGEPLDLADRLPPLDPFVTELIVNWLSDRLQEIVAPEDLETCQEYLKRRLDEIQGQPAATYRAIKEVLGRLKGAVV